MGDHFAAFSFVDRISELVPGTRARGTFAIPPRIAEFPRALVAEAVGQLAAWVSMSTIEFRGRPVAALAEQTRFFDEARPGDALDLAVELTECDDDAVAYGGDAFVGGRRVAELTHCLGPMLPCADFDDPAALRARFDLLCAGGAVPHRFNGVTILPATVGVHKAGVSLRARLDVPAAAPFFADHFPRRAVFPATLLLDAQMRLASRLAAERDAGDSPWRLSRMTHVKVRAFTPPGDVLDLEADAQEVDTSTLRVNLGARREGKSVATARVEFRRETQV
jgi:3-hydroxymyristoyl/3-hydroxydecanoyl-(acyl carrier protein) dehydratase